MANIGFVVNIEHRGQYQTTITSVFSTIEQLQEYLREVVENREHLFHVTITVDYGAIIVMGND